MESMAKSLSEDNPLNFKKLAQASDVKIKSDCLKQLVSLADKMDSHGFSKTANILDRTINKLIKQSAIYDDNPSYDPTPFSKAALRYEDVARDILPEMPYDLWSKIQYLAAEGRYLLYRKSVLPFMKDISEFHGRLEDKYRKVLESNYNQVKKLFMAMPVGEDI